MRVLAWRAPRCWDIILLSICRYSDLSMNCAARLSSALALHVSSFCAIGTCMQQKQYYGIAKDSQHMFIQYLTSTLIQVLIWYLIDITLNSAPYEATRLFQECHLNRTAKSTSHFRIPFLREWFLPPCHNPRVQPKNVTVRAGVPRRASQAVDAAGAGPRSRGSRRRSAERG